MARDDPMATGGKLGPCRAPFCSMRLVREVERVRSIGEIWEIDERHRRAQQTVRARSRRRVQAFARSFVRQGGRLPSWPGPRSAPPASWGWWVRRKGNDAHESSALRLPLTGQPRNLTQRTKMRR